MKEHKSSHGNDHMPKSAADSVTYKKLPKGFVKLAHTLNASVAAFANRAKKIYDHIFNSLRSQR